MHDRTRIFHVNMLRKWHVPNSIGYLNQEVGEETDEVPSWDNEGGEPKVGHQLTVEQNKQLHDLLQDFKGVFRNIQVIQI